MSKEYRCVEIHIVRFVSGVHQFWNQKGIFNRLSFGGCIFNWTKLVHISNINNLEMEDDLRSLLVKLSI